MKSRILNYLKQHGVLIFCSIIIGFVIALGIWFLYNPNGSLYATVGAFVVAILIPLLSIILDRVAGIRLHQILVLFFSALIALGLALLVIPPVFNGVSAIIFRWSTQDVTSNIQLTNNKNMKDGAEAQATLPETQHQHLTIVFRLDNPNTTGACVASSGITLIPIAKNGTSGEKVTSVRSGQSIGLDNIMSVRRLAIVLSQADPYCTVDVNIDSAIYSQ